MNNSVRLIIILVFFSLLTGFVPNPDVLKVNWKDLQDVRFRKRVNKDDGLVYLFPDFGPKVKALEGQQIEIRGFMIPVDPSGQLIVLSANPMASCFFCGGAGPSTIIQLKLNKPVRFSTDEVRTVRGRLRLNAYDVEELNYILEKAEFVEKK